MPGRPGDADGRPAAPVLDARAALRPSCPQPDGRAHARAPAGRGPGRLPRHATARSACSPRTARTAAPRCSSAATRSAGLRCVYHGWKFDVDRRAASTCRTSRPRATSRTRCGRAPIRASEVNGVIWVYMGPRETPPPLPDLRDQHAAGRAGVAAAHHDGGVQLGAGARGRHRLLAHRLGARTPAQDSSASAARGTFNKDAARASRCCRRTMAPATPARRRSDDEGLYWHRITQFVLPFYTMIAASEPDTFTARVGAARRRAPHAVRRCGRLDRPVTEEERRHVRRPFAACGRLLPSHQRPADALLHAARTCTTTTCSTTSCRRTS